MNKTKIYFAHSKKIYGLEVEEEMRAHIEQQFPLSQVICPNRDMGELGSMKPYEEKVESCNMVVCAEHNGSIGKGQFCEILTAMKKGIQVMVICKAKGKDVFWKPLNFTAKYNYSVVIGVVTRDTNDWKVHYAQLITEP